MTRRDNTDRQDDNDDRADLSLTKILENPEVTRAVNVAVEAWAKSQPELIKLRFRALHLGIAFSCLVIVGIGALVYLSVLSKDVTGSLLGALIGYWYGRYQGGTK